MSALKKGANHPMFGKTYSEEVKYAKSVAMKEKILYNQVQTVVIDILNDYHLSVYPSMEDAAKSINVTRRGIAKAVDSLTVVKDQYIFITYSHGTSIPPLEDILSLPFTFDSRRKLIKLISPFNISEDRIFNTINDASAFLSVDRAKVSKALKSGNPVNTWKVVQLSNKLSN